MKKVNCRFPVLLFLLGIIFTGCSDSINTMLEEYNGNFTVVDTEYTSPCPGDEDFDESKMLFEEYVVSYTDTLTLAAPKRCNSYRWHIYDPENGYQEITPKLFNGGTNTHRIYSMYIEESGLECGKTYRLLLAVYGESTRKWHYCASSIVVYKHLTPGLKDSERIYD